MNFRERITGSDLTNDMKAFDARVKRLPDDYIKAWYEIKTYLWSHSDFTGRNLIPILEGVIGLLEETVADDLSVREVLGDDIRGFCLSLAREEGAKSYLDKRRDQLNKSIVEKLSK